MAQRATRVETWSYFEHTLASSEVAQRGHIACIDLDSGEIVPGSAAEDLLPIGYFDEDKTGDGTKKVRVRFFSPKWIHRVTNDTDAGAVDVADIGSMCFIKDSSTVSITGTSRSVAGRVWMANASYVWVEMASDIGPQGPQGEEGPPGGG